MEPEGGASAVLQENRRNRICEDKARSHEITKEGFAYGNCDYCT